MRALRMMIGLTILVLSGCDDAPGVLQPLVLAEGAKAEAPVDATLRTVPALKKHVPAARW